MLVLNTVCSGRHGIPALSMIILLAGAASDRDIVQSRAEVVRGLNHRSRSCAASALAWPNNLMSCMKCGPAPES